MRCNTHLKSIVAARGVEPRNKGEPETRGTITTEKVAKWIVMGRESTFISTWVTAGLDFLISDER